MIKNLDEILTETILSYIPKNVKPFKYLMEALDIGRESTYRRIRGNIPFTFEEIVKLSSKLNFSIDEIIEKNIKNVKEVSDYQQKARFTAERYFYITHLSYYRMLQSIMNTEKIEISVTLNRLFSLFVVNFDTLFKFYYYVWLHRFGDSSFNSAFSEIQLPTPVVSIQEKIKTKISLINNVTFIFDRYILQKLIKDLQYYHIRKLITDEELQEIKNDIINFIDYIEKRIQVGGTGETSSTNHYYLSLLNIDINSMYGTIGGNLISRYWPCADTSQNIGKDDLIASHNNWIHSLKRSSILISQSNEIAQATFLNQQRKNIEMITNDLFLYYG